METTKTIELPEIVITAIDLTRDDVNKCLNKIKEFLNRSEKTRRKIDTIAIHCTATKEGVEYSMESIDKSHKNRGFKKQSISGMYCGYHFVISLDGKIMFGRDLQEIGAHVSGFNSHSIGISYIGGLDKKGKAKDTRTDEQKLTLKWLIDTLKEKLGIEVVKGHRDFSPDKNGDGKITPDEWIKMCPCFDAQEEYKQ